MIRDPITLAQDNINKKMSLFRRRLPLTPCPARLLEIKVPTDTRPQAPASTRLGKRRCKTGPSLFSERVNVDNRGSRTPQDLASIGSHLKFKTYQPMRCLRGKMSSNLSDTVNILY
jgi:hypothetical protein